MKKSTAMEPRIKVDGLQYIRDHERDVLDFIKMLLPAESEALSAIDISMQTNVAPSNVTNAIHSLSYFGIFDYVGRLNKSKKIYFKADVEKVSILQDLLTKVKNFGFIPHERTMISMANLAMRFGRDPNGADIEMVGLLKRDSQIRKRLMTDDVWFSTHKGAHTDGRTFTFTPTTEMHSVALVWRTISAILTKWRDEEDSTNVFLIPETVIERPRLRLVA